MPPGRRADPITETWWYELAVDWKEAKRIGIERQRIKDQTGGEPGHTIENIVGTAGELAFSRAFRLPMPVFDPLKTSDEGHDFLTPFGRIDVKACQKSPYYLGVTDLALSKKEPADWYTLIWTPPNGAVGWIVGYCDRKTVIASPRCLNTMCPEDDDPKELKPGHKVPLATLEHPDDMVGALLPLCPICYRPYCIAPACAEIFDRLSY